MALRSKQSKTDVFYFLLLYSSCATIRQKPGNYIFVLVVLFDMIDFEQLRLSVSEIMSVQ